MLCICCIFVLRILLKTRWFDSSGLSINKCKAQLFGWNASTKLQTSAGMTACLKKTGSLCSPWMLSRSVRNIAEPAWLIPKHFFVLGVCLKWTGSGLGLGAITGALCQSLRDFSPVGLSVVLLLPASSALHPSKPHPDLRLTWDCLSLLVCGVCPLDTNSKAIPHWSTTSLLRYVCTNKCVHLCICGHVTLRSLWDTEQGSNYSSSVFWESLNKEHIGYFVRSTGTE